MPNSMSVAQQVSYRTDIRKELDLTTGASGYVNRLRDAFVLNERDDPDTPEEEVIRENRGSTTVAGVELEAAVEAPLWALRTGWTYERASNENADEDFSEARIFRTPRHYGYIEALVKVKGLQVQSGADFTGPMLVPRFDENADPLDVVESPWFAAWNLNVGYAALAMDTLILEPFVGVRNILDSRQGAPNVFGPGETSFSQGADRDSNFVFGPIQPRSVFVGVRGTL